MSQLRSPLQAPSRFSVLLSRTGGIALVGLGVYLAYQGWGGAGIWFWVGAVVSGLIGLGMNAGSTMEFAPCPACGDKHWIITPGVYETCDACNVYLQGDASAIWIVDDEHVAEEPVFKLNLEEDGFYWPEGCCVCGESATRAISVEFSESQVGRNVALAAAGLAAGAVLIRTGGGSSGSVDVPHCDEHDDGAALAKNGVLRLRSHGYFQRFRELNDDATSEPELETQQRAAA